MNIDTRLIKHWWWDLRDDLILFQRRHSSRLFMWVVKRIERKIV